MSRARLGRLAALTLALWGAALRTQEDAGEIRLASLDLSVVRQGWGVARADRGVTKRPLVIDGQRFEHGVGTHARSQLWLELDGKANKHLIKFLAKQFKVPLDRVEIMSGDNSRQKRILIVDPQVLPAALQLDRKGDSSAARTTRT